MPSELPDSGLYRHWTCAGHRTQAHVEDKIKEVKAMGARSVLTADTGRNPPCSSWPPWPSL